MKLSIVIPACNEEQRIGSMLDAYLPFFQERFPEQVEFLVVVNGSTDGTEALVRSYADKHPGLRVMVEPERIGKGGALILGFDAARGELVGFTDADGATPPAAFHDLVERIGSTDCVIASRWNRDSTVSPRQPLIRRITSRIFNVATRLLFGLRFTDTQCGAKLMKREAIRKVLPDLGVTKWAFDVDLLIHLREAGFQIQEAPTVWHDVAGSKVEIARASTEMVAALVRLRLLYSPLQWTVGLYDRFLGPLIHPPKMEEDRLFRHSLLLMAGSQVCNVLNVLFQSGMAWLLSNGEYGTMATMLGMMWIVGAPLGALGQGVSHYTAALLQKGRRDEVNALVRSLARDLTVVLLLMAAGAAMGGFGFVARFYHLESTLPVIIVGISVAISLYGAIPGGALSGGQAFLWVSGLGAIGSASRLAAGLLLVGCVGLGAVGALIGHGLSVLLSVLGSVYAMRQILGTGSAPSVQRAGFYRYVFKYMIGLLALSILMTADVLIAKRYFSAEEAGLFAKAAMVARSVVFLPAPIAVALFPKVVSAGETEPRHGRTLLKALILTAFMIGCGAMMCTLFPGFLLRMLTRTADPEAIRILRAMVWALAPISVIQILMNFQLAQRRFRVNWILVLCSLGYLGAAMVWHDSLLQIAAVLGCAAVAATGLLIASLPWRRLRSMPAGTELQENSA